MTTEQNNKENFVNFRLSKLEEAVTTLVSNLSTLKDIVVRWDTRISETGGPLPCSLHAERIGNLSKKVDEQNEKIKEMKTEIDGFTKIIYKATGILVALSLVVQIAGPILINKFFHNPPKVEFIEKQNQR